MGRSTLTTPYPRLTNEAVQPVVKGGTGNTTNASTVSTLNLIPKSSLNAPNGILTKVGGVVPSETIASAGVVSGATVTGPTSMLSSSNATFTITNYDSTRGYDVVAVGGSVSRNVETISYTAPAVAGSYGFTVNGKRITVSVSVPTVNTPSVTSPVNGATGLQYDTINFTSSAFGISGGSDTHYSSDWQLSTNNNFTNIVKSISDSGVAKTSLVVSGLNPNTVYYVRVKHRGTLFGYSSWSNAVSFTTKDIPYPDSEFSKIIPSDGSFEDRFGTSVSISNDGNIIVVGAPGVEINVSGTVYQNVGCIYIYERISGSWTLRTKISPSNFVEYMHFGYSVSMNGDGSTIIVGAPGSENEKGRAYIIVRGGSSWGELIKLLPSSNSAGGDYFGLSVSISSDGNTAIVGAYYDDSYRGSAYIYTRSGGTWSQQAKLTASDGNSGFFGYSVSISSDGNTAIVGAYGDDSNRGSAYIYTRSGSTWTQQTKLLASDGAFYDNFGISVAISSDGGTIGISKSSNRGIYIYTLSGGVWSQQTKITSINNYLNFPSLSFSDNGDILSIGTNNYGSGRGSVHVFVRTSGAWTSKTTILPSDTVVSGLFGVSVGMTGNGGMLVVGASGNDDKGTNSGAAYIFV